MENQATSYEVDEDPELVRWSASLERCPME